MKVDIFDGNHEWMFPGSAGKFYLPLFDKATSYDEFALLANIHGYVDPDTTRRYDETLDLVNRYEPYESFIFEAAVSGGYWSRHNKLQKFRNQLIELDIEKGDRDKEGVIIPTKYQIQHCKQTREWCQKYHPEFLNLRGC